MFLPTAVLAVPTLLTIHTYNHADWPHDMQQLLCVLLVKWIPDADSFWGWGLQSLVNLNCLRCGKSDTVSSQTQLHQATRRMRNEVH